MLVCFVDYYNSLCQHCCVKCGVAGARHRVEGGAALTVTLLASRHSDNLFHGKFHASLPPTVRSARVPPPGRIHSLQSATAAVVTDQHEFQQIYFLFYYDYFIYFIIILNSRKKIIRQKICLKRVYITPAAVPTKISHLQLYRNKCGETLLCKGGHKYHFKFG